MVDRREAYPTDGEEMINSNRLARRDFLKSGLTAAIGTAATFWAGRYCIGRWAGLAYGGVEENSRCPRNRLRDGFSAL